MTPQERMLVKATRPQRTPRLSVGSVAVQLGVEFQGDPDIEITGVSMSAERLLEGDVFVALPGERAHGIRDALAAVDAGAVAIFTDQAGMDRANPHSPEFAGVAFMLTEDPGERLAELTDLVYGSPLEQLSVVTVVGSRRSPLVVERAEALLAALGKRSAVIGSAGVAIAGKRLGDAAIPADVVALHALLALMRDSGVALVLLHLDAALLKEGVAGGLRDLTVFLEHNPDDTEAYVDQASYFEAKRRVVVEGAASTALVCVDDQYGRTLIADARANDVPLQTFSARPAGFLSRASRADWRVTRLKYGDRDTRFVLAGPQVKRQVVAAPVKQSEVGPLVAALVLLRLSGFDLDAMVAHLAAEAEAVANRPVEAEMRNDGAA